MRIRRPLVFAAGSVVVGFVLCALLVRGHAAPPVTVATVRAPFAHGVLPAAADAGSPQQRAAVRAAALQALTDEVQVFAIDRRYRDEPPDRVLAALTSPAAERSRMQLLRRSRSEKLATDVDHAVDFSLRQDFVPNRRCRPISTSGPRPPSTSTHGRACRSSATAPG